MMTMKMAVVSRFGGPEVIQMVERGAPIPGPGQVVVGLTSVGMNQADVMGRKGGYKLSTGEVPYVPGIEGGGRVLAVGAGVKGVEVDQRVILTPGAPRRAADAPGDAYYLGGTYRTHYLCDEGHLMPVPEGVPEELTGALWLAFLTAWGCLVWKQGVKKGDFVGLPACSSSVAIAAAQFVRQAGGIPIGLTTSPGKVGAIQEKLPGLYEAIVVTHEGGKMLGWHKNIKEITGGHGVDVYFDPVAAGEYLSTEVRSLAQFGTIWVYGLLGKPDVVDVQPLIRKYAGIRGWLLGELTQAGRQVWGPACEMILKQVAAGELKMPVAGSFALEDAAIAQEEMERGGHIGKFVLVP